MMQYSRNVTRGIVYFIIFYILFCGFAIKNLGVPKSIMFILDIVALFLFTRDIFRLKSTGMVVPFSLLIINFICLIPSILYNQVNPANIVWGIRNQYWALALFLGTASYLTYKNIQQVFRYFYYFQILNVLCAIYQYFILGLKQDFNNGAFINGAGQDIFCGMLCAYFFFSYINKKCKIYEFTFILLSSLFIAAVEEEKFIFAEIAIVFGYYFFTTKFNWKKIIMSIIAIPAFGLGLMILAEINGQSSVDVLFNSESRNNYLDNAFELPRIGATPILSHLFFNDDMQHLFGLGIGACEDSSSLSIIDSTFFNRFGKLNYSYFTFHINFMQTGWIGISLLILFFVAILGSYIYYRKKSPKQYIYMYDIAIIITLLCISTFWYNATLRSYNTYIPFFGMAIGAVMTRQLKRINSLKKRLK